MRDREKGFVSAVIYVHNAADRVGGFLEMVIRVLEENFEHSEIICVDDRSEDGSLQAVKEASAAARTTSISVLGMSHFHGRERAMGAGVDLSIGDLVFEFDDTVSDLREDVVMQVYDRAMEGYDIVSASPDREERLSSRLFYQVFDRFADLPYGMGTESFRLLSRRAINRVGSMNRTVPYRKVAYAESGLRMDNIHYVPAVGVGQERDKGEEGYRIGLAVDALLLFTGVGYKFSIAMTFAMMLMSLSMTLYSIVVYATSHPIAGWTTTILFLSVAFFGLFGISTIIIKYLQLLLELVAKRKPYSFESIEKLTR